MAKEKIIIKRCDGCVTGGSIQYTYDKKRHKESFGNWQSMKAETDSIYSRISNAVFDKKKVTITIEEE